MRRHEVVQRGRRQGQGDAPFRGPRNGQQEMASAVLERIKNERIRCPRLKRCHGGEPPDGDGAHPAVTPPARRRKTSAGTALWPEAANDSAIFATLAYEGRSASASGRPSIGRSLTASRSATRGLSRARCATGAMMRRQSQAPRGLARTSRIIVPRCLEIAYICVV